MAVDTAPTVDVRTRLRQVPVQELVLPVVIIALIIVGVIIRPGVFLTSDNLLTCSPRQASPASSPLA